MLCYFCADPNPSRQAVARTAVSNVPICQRCKDYHFPADEDKTPIDKEPVKAKVEAAAVKPEPRWKLWARDVGGNGETTALHYEDKKSGERFKLHLGVWKYGGCIFCGDTSKPRPKTNKMSHGECFRKMTAIDEAIIDIAREAII